MEVPRESGGREMVEGLSEERGCQASSVCVCVTAGVHHRGEVAGGRRERFGSEAVFRLGRKRSNEPIYQKLSLIHI